MQLEERSFQYFKATAISGSGQFMYSFWAQKIVNVFKFLKPSFRSKLTLFEFFENVNMYPACKASFHW